jgi:hypothetical protein
MIPARGVFPLPALDEHAAVISARLRAGVVCRGDPERPARETFEIAGVPTGRASEEFVADTQACRRWTKVHYLRERRGG